LEGVREDAGEGHQIRNGVVDFLMGCHAGSSVLLWRSEVNTYKLWRNDISGPLFLFLK